MEHHYSLTGRMLAIFVGGLVVLGILLFAAGLLAGREWGASDAIERLSAAKHSSANQAAPTAQAAVPAAVPAAPQSAATPGTGAAEGAIRPATALPPFSAAPALPAAPVLPKPPKAPAAPKPPSLPAAPKLPNLSAAPKLPNMSAAPKLPLPAGSSQGNRLRDAGPARLTREVAEAPAKVAAVPAGKPEAAVEGDAAVHGYVVYVGAFENTAKAEILMDELKSRNLDAQTSIVARPGRKPLLTVWVGPFNGRADAVAVLPTIRDAGVNDVMIRSVP
jgi:SPOR domain